VLGGRSSSSIDDDDENDVHNTRSGVDSLNVCVTGGVLLCQDYGIFCQSMFKMMRQLQSCQSERFNSEIRH
jgi:hypothetical protein